MYLGYFENEENTEGDNPPMGIVLAREKDELVVKYAMHNNNSRLFVSKYQLYLPFLDTLCYYSYLNAKLPLNYCNFFAINHSKSDCITLRRSESYNKTLTVSNVLFFAFSSSIIFILSVPTKLAFE